MMRTVLCKNRRKDCCCYCCRFVVVVWNWLCNVNIHCLNSADTAESAEVAQPFLTATTSIRLVKMQRSEAITCPVERVDHWLRRQSRQPQVITAQPSGNLDEISIVDSVDSVIEEAKVIRRRRKRLMKMTRPPRRSFYNGFAKLRRRCGIFLLSLSLSLFLSLSFSLSLSLSLFLFLSRNWTNLLL